VPRLARLSADGTPDTVGLITGEGFDRAVTAIAVVRQSTDFYVGGEFGAYDGREEGHLVRLHADGTRDVSFGTGAGFDGNITDLSLGDDGVLTVRGSFTQYDGQPAAGTARLDARGALVETPAP
jgi:hypothetical protein